MSQYYGDIQLGDTIEWLFTTVDTTPVPFTLIGSPTATAYTDGGATQSATGVTIVADFDGVTGLHKITVVATGGNGFAAGENIEIVMSAGTVDGNSVIGYAVGSFSIENRSNLRPTVVGNNEVDVLATGEVGIDFANINGTLAAGDIAASALDGKGDWNINKTGYALTTADWNVGKSGYSLTTADWNVGKTGYSVDTLAANTITAASINALAFEAGKFAANWLEAGGIVAAALNGKGDWNIGKTGYSLTVADWNVGKTGYTLTTQDWALASEVTAARMSELDDTSGKLVNQMDIVQVDTTTDIPALLPAALVSGRMDSNVSAINDDANSAAQLALSTLGIVSGVCEGSPSTTNIPSDLTEITVDHYKGRIVTFTTGAVAGQSSDITGYAADGALTVTALTNNPSSGDLFVIT